MLEPTVRRTVELATSTDDLWHLISDPGELGAWLGGEADLAVRPGAAGRLVEHDGTVRRVSIDRVEAGRSIGFTWWVEGDEGSASTVELTVGEADGEREGSTLTVVERPKALAGGRTCQASALGGGWDDRLLGLELSVLTRGLLVTV